MVSFRVEPCTPAVTRIYAITDVQMYLVCGKHRAVLIDTGSGAGDLRKVVRSLTDLPTDVLLTHAHVDHGMGSTQFERVFMDPRDHELYENSKGLDVRRAYLATSPEFAKLEDSDYIAPDEPQRFLCLRDKDVFDLGGITVEAVSCPGHTQGATMFLIREERLLLTGDCCNYFTMLQGEGCLSISAYEESLRRAEARTRGKYDGILLSHGFVTAPQDLIRQNIQVCEEIRSGTDDKIPFEFLGSRGLVAKAYGKRGNSSFLRVDGGFGNIVYNPENIG